MQIKAPQQTHVILGAKFVPKTENSQQFYGKENPAYEKNLNQLSYDRYKRKTK
jgi:hypothetical protein